MAREVARFKRVLRVREVERDISQSELAAKQAEEERIVRKLNEAEAEKENALADFCAERKRVVSPQELWFERQNLDLMEARLDTQKNELSKTRVEIEEQKSDLLEKHRSVQLMGKHVDRLQAIDFKKSIDAEQSNLDDITSMRYLRGFGKEAGA